MHPFFFLGGGGEEMVDSSNGLGGIVFRFLFEGMASPQDATRPPKISLMRCF